MTQIMILIKTLVVGVVLGVLEVHVVIVAVLDEVLLVLDEVPLVLDEFPLCLDMQLLIDLVFQYHHLCHVRKIYIDNCYALIIYYIFIYIILHICISTL